VLAVSVRVPDGLDSDSLYVCATPLGRPLMKKVTVSVGATMVTGVEVVEPWGRFIVVLLRETVRKTG
jgi:hypothetical protein